MRNPMLSFLALGAGLGIVMIMVAFVPLLPNTVMRLAVLGFGIVLYGYSVYRVIVSID